MSRILKLVFLSLVFAVLTAECRLHKRSDWGLLQGWTWNSWNYFWYGRHGKIVWPTDEDTICQQLWNADVNRYHQGVEYDILLQSKVSETSNRDRANWPLFRFALVEMIRRRPTFRTFMDLQSKFDPTQRRNRRLTGTPAEIKNNVREIITEVFKTRVFDELYWFLVRKDHISPGKEKFKDDMLRIWFNNNNINYTQISGFENVFVGETVSNPKKISFRSWLQFSSLERTTTYLNYYGYIRIYNLHPKVISLKYSWGNGAPVSDNMFLGTTPEFELALYTLCFYTHPGRECTCKLNTKKIVVKTVPTADGSALRNAFFDLKT